MSAPKSKADKAASAMFRASPAQVRVLALLCDSLRYPFEPTMRSDLPALRALIRKGWLKPADARGGPWILTAAGDHAAKLARHCYLTGAKP